jgi:glycogen synthase kinase 3 beta
VVRIVSLFQNLTPLLDEQVFRSRTPPEAIDFISQLLQYTPTKRLTALDAMTHPFFDELRNPETRLANGKELPNLFDFSVHGK